MLSWISWADLCVWRLYLQHSLPVLLCFDLWGHCALASVLSTFHLYSMFPWSCELTFWCLWLGIWPSLNAVSSLSSVGPSRTGILLTNGALWRLFPMTRERFACWSVSSFLFLLPWFLNCDINRKLVNVIRKKDREDLVSTEVSSGKTLIGFLHVQEKRLNGNRSDNKCNQVIMSASYVSSQVFTALNVVSSSNKGGLGAVKYVK